MKCNESVFFGSERCNCIETAPHTRHSAQHKGKLVTWTNDTGVSFEESMVQQQTDTGSAVESKEGVIITRFGRGGVV